MKSRNVFLANVAMVSTQTIFGIGNVVAFIYLSGNPIVFALIREAIAGPLLLLLAFTIPRIRCNNSTKRKRNTSQSEVRSLSEASKGEEDVDDSSDLDASQSRPPSSYFVKWSIVCGLCLFGCNFCYIVGLKLAGALSAAIWQPSQPIITGAAGLILGIEKFYCLKFAGIVIAVLGCAFHVLYPELIDQTNTTNSTTGTGEGLVLLGNACLFMNCFCISMFYIFQKKLLKYQSPILVLGYSYAIATVFMVCAALLFNNIPQLLAVVCPECTGNSSGWHIPSQDLVGILYWVFAGSIGGYFFFSWANQFIEASLVAAYTALQPVTTGIATYLALAIEPTLATKGTQRLSTPGLGELGTIPIVAGLAMVVYSDYRVSQQMKAAAADTVDSVSGPPELQQLLEDGEQSN